MREIIECECGECYKTYYHGVICPNCGKNNKINDGGEK